MRENKDHPSLRLIEGEARSSTSGSGQLITVARREHAGQMQLPLPGVGPARTALIWATIGTLASRSASDWLRDLSVRKIVDLRVAPSFRRLGMRSRGFVELAREFGASYVHLAKLANRFAGESWHAESYRQRLQRHFDENHQSVVQLREMVDDGPVLLIITERSAMEQELLLQALERVSPGFETQRITTA